MDDATPESSEDGALKPDQKKNESPTVKRPFERRNVVLAALSREDGGHKYHNRLAPEFQQSAEEQLIKRFLSNSHSIVECQLPDVARSTYLMAFSRDGKMVASCHGNHKIYVTDMKTGKNLKTLSGHPRTPWCIEFHPTSSQILASGCLGGQVRVWDLHGGSATWTIENKAVIASLAFHPTSRLLVIASSNELLFWDWNEEKPRARCSTQRERERVRYVAFDYAGHKLITGISNKKNESRSQGEPVVVTSNQSFGSRLTVPSTRTGYNGLWLEGNGHILSTPGASRSNTDSGSPTQNAESNRSFPPYRTGITGLWIGSSLVPTSGIFTSNSPSSSQSTDSGRPSFSNRTGLSGFWINCNEHSAPSTTRSNTDSTSTTVQNPDTNRSSVFQSRLDHLLDVHISPETPRFTALFTRPNVHVLPGDSTSVSQSNTNRFRGSDDSGPSTSSAFRPQSSQVRLGGSSTTRRPPLVGIVSRQHGSTLMNLRRLSPRPNSDGVCPVVCLTHRFARNNSSSNGNGPIPIRILTRPGGVRDAIRSRMRAFVRLTARNGSLSGASLMNIARTVTAESATSQTNSTQTSTTQTSTTQTSTTQTSTTQTNTTQTNTTQTNTTQTNTTQTNTTQTNTTQTNTTQTNTTQTNTTQTNTTQTNTTQTNATQTSTTQTSAVQTDSTQTNSDQTGSRSPVSADSDQGRLISPMGEFINRLQMWRHRYISQLQQQRSQEGYDDGSQTPEEMEGDLSDVAVAGSNSSESSSSRLSSLPGGRPQQCQCQEDSSRSSSFQLIYERLQRQFTSHFPTDESSTSGRDRSPLRSTPSTSSSNPHSPGPSRRFCSLCGKERSSAFRSRRFGRSHTSEDPEPALEPERVEAPEAQEGNSDSSSGSQTHAGNDSDSRTSIPTSDRQRFIALRTIELLQEIIEHVERMVFHQSRAVQTLDELSRSMGLISGDSSRSELVSDMPASPLSASELRLSAFSSPSPNGRVESPERSRQDIPYNDLITHTLGLLSHRVRDLRRRQEDELRPAISAITHSTREWRSDSSRSERASDMPASPLSASELRLSAFSSPSPNGRVESPERSRQDPPYNDLITHTLGLLSHRVRDLRRRQEDELRPAISAITHSTREWRNLYKLLNLNLHLADHLITLFDVSRHIYRVHGRLVYGGDQSSSPPEETFFGLGHQVARTLVNGVWEVVSHAQVMTNLACSAANARIGRNASVTRNSSSSVTSLFSQRGDSSWDESSRPWLGAEEYSPGMSPWRAHASSSNQEDLPGSRRRVGMTWHAEVAQMRLLTLSTFLRRMLVQIASYRTRALSSMERSQRNRARAQPSNERSQQSPETNDIGPSSSHTLRSGLTPPEGSLRPDDDLNPWVVRFRRLNVPPWPYSGEGSQRSQRSVRTRRLYNGGDSDSDDGYQQNAPDSDQIPTSSHAFLRPVPLVRLNDMPISDNEMNGLDREDAPPRNVLEEMIQDEDANPFRDNDSDHNNLRDFFYRFHQLHHFRDPFTFTNNVTTSNQRIQAWDFSLGHLPDLSSINDQNLVVPECRINNDASVDISADGQFLVAFLYGSNRTSGRQFVGVYSLRWDSLGQVLYRHSFDQVLVSVSLSPTASHLLIGLASRRPPYPYQPAQAQVFRLEGARPGRIVGTMGRLLRVCNLKLGTDRRPEGDAVSLNCIRWSAVAGQGLAFGTNAGQLTLLR